jgi:hypothetical protein
MFNILQFRESIVKSTLNDLLLYSPEAEELLVFTCATESRGGSYIRQVNGPALGIYQMEPETYNDIWQNYLKDKTNLCMILFSNFEIGFQPSPDRLIYDLRLSTAMARLFYSRIKEPLPSSKDIDSIWDYYKKYYNTPKGKAQKFEAIQKYHDFLGN